MVAQILERLLVVLIWNMAADIRSFMGLTLCAACCTETPRMAWPCTPILSREARKVLLLEGTVCAWAGGEACLRCSPIALYTSLD